MQHEGSRPIWLRALTALCDSMCVCVCVCVCVCSVCGGECHIKEEALHGSTGRVL